jgi:hypothetical protein
LAPSVHTSSLRREKKGASSGSTLRFANSSDDFPTSVTPPVHLSGTYEILNWIGTDLSHRVANQISLTCFCDFFFKQPFAIRASNFTPRELPIGAVAHKQCTIVLGTSELRAMTFGNLWCDFLLSWEIIAVTLVGTKVVPRTRDLQRFLDRAVTRPATPCRTVAVDFASRGAYAQFFRRR